MIVLEQIAKSAIQNSEDRDVTRLGTLLSAGQRNPVSFCAGLTSEMPSPITFWRITSSSGGSPYGATTIAGGDGSCLPTANELEGARYRGRKIAETANKLHG